MIRRSQFFVGTCSTGEKQIAAEMRKRPDGLDLEYCNLNRRRMPDLVGHAKVQQMTGNQLG